MMTGRPFSPVRAVTICCMAESSAIMYKNIVTSVKKLKYMAATKPYLCLVHSVRTKPSGHLLLITGPRTAKIIRGTAELTA